MNYYNEHDPKAAAWLRENIKSGLIPQGEVDERSITEIKPHELTNFTQCHFFAGIGGWSLALQLAGWPADRSVWTGSCPCQPFSSAGKGLGDKDERHLWPVFFDLIAKCRPQTVFGEQVASASVVGSQLEAAFLVAVQSGKFARANKLAKQLAQSSAFHYHRRWLDGVSADLEAAGYACGSAVLGAHSVGAPHIRQRLYWVADAGHGECRRQTEQDTGGKDPTQRRQAAVHAERCSSIIGVADANGGRLEQCDTGQRSVSIVDEDRANGGMGDTGCQRDESGRGTGNLGCATDKEQSQARQRQRSGDAYSYTGADRGGHWSDFDLIPCRDGKSRRVEPGTFPLAHGVPARVGLLRGYGNAIVPQAAAQFIRAYAEAYKH